MPAAAMSTVPEPSELAELLGQDDGDAEFLAACRVALTTVTALARSYTRGQGFGPDRAVAEDIAAVILVAGARYVNNPENLKREELDGYSVTPSQFVGWSLVELAVLNRYRVRAL